MCFERIDWDAIKFDLNLKSLRYYMKALHTFILIYPYHLMKMAIAISNILKLMNKRANGNSASVGFYFMVKQKPAYYNDNG